MSVAAWVVLAVVLATMTIMALDRLPTAAAIGLGLVVLLVTGTIDDSIVLSGLSSSATATIAALYVVAAAVSMTGALSWVLDRVLFGRTGAIARLAGSAAAMSAFVPNTPLVALAAPRVMRWSRTSGIDASRLLMPLSFATILGGVVTLLGTSTNLVVSDVLARTDAEPIGIFEVTPIGLPVAIAGVVVLSLTAPYLLRDRRSSGPAAVGREFESQMVVDLEGPIAGRTVMEAGLRDLDGLYLAAIERNDRVITAAANTVLRGGDHLYFVGDVARIVDLQDIVGLSSAEQQHMLDTEGPGVRLYEAVVAGRSDLAGRTLKDAGFRSRYGAAVLAVQRAGGGMRGKLGSVTLHPGDVLVVLAGPEFARRWREHGDFSLSASLEEPPPPRRNRAWLAAGALALMVLLSATGLLSLFGASVIAAGIVVAGGALSVTEARQAVDLNVVLTIAASVSLGNSVAASGLAAEAGQLVVSLAEPLGTVGMLAAVIVATQLMTEALSNAGAAAVMVPIAIATADQIGADPRQFAFGVMIGASCSFLTPVGYQTNLMVYSLGGYKFSDFSRVGFPLTITAAAVSTTMLTLVF